MSHPEIVAHLPQVASAGLPHRSPFDLPELASLICSYIGTRDLARCARVSRLLHDVCIPILWRTLDLPRGAWSHDREFHKGLGRYGKLYPVERLHLISTTLQDSDFILLAENCTRLKHLDLTFTRISVEDLRILIHSDPYGVLDGERSGRTKKRKAATGPSLRRIRGATELEEGDDSANEQPDEDLNAIMERYRQFLETNAAPARTCQYNSLEPSAAEGSNACPMQIFPGTKTWFPFHLESLNFKNSIALDGAACLEVVSLLGPQLKRLVLDMVFGITNQALMTVVKHCPNLVELQLEHTGITDEFLTSFAREFLPSDSTSKPSSQRRYLERLSLNRTLTSSTGLLAIIKACRCHFNTLSMQYHTLDDRVLFALVDDPGKKGAAEISMAAPYLTSAVEYGIDNALLTTYRFSPNTVLTNIDLSDCRAISDVGLQVLFHFATELTSIGLRGSSLSDDSLMVLAGTYRSRMMALGMGVPAAWKEYEVADKRAQAMDPTGAAIDLQDSRTTSTSDDNEKTFTKGRVPGGLKKLVLSSCYNITNTGVRAILRSCAGLESLDIQTARNLSLELFQGPWACTNLTELVINGLALEVTLDRPTAEYYLDTSPRKNELREERLESLWRFPLAITSYPAEDDYDEKGHYDHIVAPREPLPGRYDVDSDSDMTEDEQEVNRSFNSRAGSYDDDEGTSSGDEGSSCSGDGSWGALSPKATRHPVPREKRCNTPRQRAILRAFYSRLGQLRRLQRLGMGFCKFRVRAKDGLELVLPGLQQSLVEWNLDYARPYRMLDPEVKFIGKHFGFGHDFMAERNETQERPEVETREAQLQLLKLSTLTKGDIDPSVLHWVGHQGFSVKSAV
ncbi:hypothetical protein BGZ70_002931, partial [Mortierella alpina]